MVLMFFLFVIMFFLFIIMFFESERMPDRRGRGWRQSASQSWTKIKENRILKGTAYRKIGSLKGKPTGQLHFNHHG